MSETNVLIQPPLQLNSKLQARYRNTDYVSRLPFFINNQVDTQQAVEKLRCPPVEAHRVFMGIAGFRALDLLSTIGMDSGNTYQQAILFDKNQAQVKMINAVLKLIDECPNPAQFRQAFLNIYPSFVNHVPSRQYGRHIQQHMSDNDQHPAFDQLREDKNFFGIVGYPEVPKTREEVQEYFNKAKLLPESFLHLQNYQRIRNLVKKGRIETIPLDLMDSARFDMLAEDFKSQNLKLGHVYVSSALDLMMDAVTNNYHGGDKALPLSQEMPVETVCKNFNKIGDEHSLYVQSSGHIPGSTKPFLLETYPAKSVVTFAKIRAERNLRIHEMYNPYIGFTASIGVGTGAMTLIGTHPTLLLGSAAISELGWNPNDVVIEVIKHKNSLHPDNRSFTPEEVNRILDIPEIVEKSLELARLATRIDGNNTMLIHIPHRDLGKIDTIKRHLISNIESLRSPISR